ncbi:MAG: PKD domain-containing protein [Chitinophagales bacterium]
MRKLVPLILSFVFLFAYDNLKGQCTNGNQYPAGSYTPPANGAWTSATTISWSGEYVVWNVVLGSTYTWSTCGTDGGNAGYDSELTLTDAGGGTVLAYSDDACGLQSRIVWTSTFNGQVRVYLHEVTNLLGLFYFYCQTNSTNSTVVCKVVHPPLPVCGSYVFPGNTQTVSSVGTTLQWNSAGGTVHGYKLYFGTNNPPTNVVNGANQGLATSYATGGLAPNQVYYWRIAPWNYGSGDQNGCAVRTFNTYYPGCVTPSFPADGAGGISTVGTSLQWAAPANPPGTPTSYKLYFGTNNPPTNIENGTNLGNVLTYSAGTLSSGTTYYWKVVPTNAQGDALSCPVFNFTTSSGPASCSNIIYVSPTGTGDGFTSASPTSLSSAIGLINLGTYGQLNEIRMLSGTYTVSGRIDIPANTFFDGGYESAGSGCDATWQKNISLTSQLDITPSLETPTVGATQIGVYRGMAAASVNNWRLQDLTINVISPSGTGQTNNRGQSFYGVHIDNCSGYEITRCKIITPAATAGTNGVTPAVGGGFSGGAGGGGGNGRASCSGGTSGAGTAGAKGNGAGGTGTGSNQNANGAAGVGGGGALSAGNSGNNGGVGAGGFGGSNSLATGSAGTYSNYFVPGGQGGTGINGGGGQGGGGGSGNNVGCVGACVFGACVGGLCGAQNGAAGGAGGQGGSGGTGGYGGGASFGIYVNGTAGTISNCNLSPGAAGAGGSGAPGSAGLGGSGGGSGACNSCIVGSRCGGNGGTGGTGGQGGTGANGSAGVSAQMATGTGTVTSPSVTIPITPVATVSAYVGATNSEITITKAGGAGNWTLPTGASYVNDVSASVSSYSATSSTAKIYFPSLPGSGALPAASGSKPAIYGLDLTYGAVTFKKGVNVSATRSLPTINPISPICVGSSINLGTSAAGSCYDWAVQKITSPNSAAVPGANLLSGSQITDQNPGVLNITVPGTYQVRLRVKDDCYGWSIPVYTSVVVNQVPDLPATVDYATCYNPSFNLTSINPTDANSTTGTYIWSLTQGGAALGSTVLSLTTPGTFTYYVRKETSTTPVCSDESEVTLTVYPTPDLPATDAQALCQDNSTIDLTDFNPADANATTGTYVWSNTSGGPALPSTIISINTPGVHTYYVRKETATSPACSDQTVFTLTIKGRPTGNLVGSTTICNGQSVNIAVFVTGTGPWSGTLSDGTTFVGNSNPIPVNVAPTSDATYTIADLSDSYCAAQPGDLSGTVTITVLPQATADAGPDISGCNGLLNTVTGATASNYTAVSWTHNGSGSLTNANTLSPTYIPAPGETSVTLTLQVTGVAPCSDMFDDMVMSFGACNSVWLGYSQDWFTATNWSLGVVPNDCAADVTIPTSPVGGFFPHINATSPQVGDMIVEASAQIDIDGGKRVSVCGRFTGGYSIPSSIIGNGELELNGSAPQLLFEHLIFNNLRLNNASGAALQAGSIFDVMNEVRLQSGTLDASGGVLHFNSLADNQIAIIDNFSAGYNGMLIGYIKADRYYHSSSTYDAHYIGSPVDNAPLSQFGAGGISGFAIPKPNCDETQLNYASPYGTVASYDQSNGASCALGGWFFETSGNAVNAKGYSIRFTGAGTVSVTGQANLNTSYSVGGLINSSWNNVSLQGRPMTSGWQLVANPYLAYLNVSNTPAGFDASKLVWHTGGPFAGSYQAATVVAPFQAFMVHVSAPGAPKTYTINASSRVKPVTPSTFQKQANSEELTITAANDSTQLLDVTTVAFNTDATVNMDADYDGIKVAGALNRHTLYTHNADPLSWLAVNTLKSIEETSTVPVGFEAGINGHYTFTFDGISSFDPTSYITLEDKKLNVWHDVRSGDYSFISNATDNFDRFVLHFTPAAHVNTVNANCNAPGQINIEQPGPASWQYTVADAQGVVVSSGTLNNSNAVTVSAQSGTYTVTLVDNNNYTVVKNVAVTGAQPIVANFAASKNVAETGEDINFTNTSLAATSVQWDMGDGAILNGPMVTHNYAAEGVYTVNMMVENADACSSSSNQTVTITAKNATGITPIADNGIKIWSNEDRVYVDFSSKKQVEATINIYNVVGQLVSSEKFGKSTIYSRKLNNLDAGYVIVNVKDNDGTVSKQVFISNSK